MKRVVGIDGGGTKARAAAYDIPDEGWDFAAPIGVGSAGPCNIALLAPEEAADAVRSAVAAAGVRPDEVAGVCAAVAGYAFASRRAPFLAEVGAMFPAARICLAPDYLAAFHAAFPAGRGLIAIAGTGSVAYGASGDGRSHRSGGYGYLIDDAGSGYGVGRRAIAAIMRSMDGSGESSVLAERIGAETGISDWDSLVEAVYGGEIDRVGIAALSKIVAQAASDGDAVAQKLLMQAARALARLVEAVYSRVFAPVAAEPVEIALAGSLWRSGDVLTEVFARSVRRFAPDTSVGSCETDPAVGAARIAAALIDGGGANTPRVPCEA